jgi:hypothetical protein
LLRRARAVPWQGQIDNGPNWPDAKHKAQLAGNRAAADLVLEADKRTALDKARPRLPLSCWHQRNTARDRLSAADRTFFGSGPVAAR